MALRLCGIFNRTRLTAKRPGALINRRQLGNHHRNDHQVDVSLCIAGGLKEVVKPRLTPSGLHAAQAGLRFNFVARLLDNIVGVPRLNEDDERCFRVARRSRTRAVGRSTRVALQGRSRSCTHR